MSFCLKKEGLLAIVLMALNATGSAKPTHILSHAAKKIVSSVRHPKKSSQGVWKLITEVF